VFLIKLIAAAVLLSSGLEEEIVIAEAVKRNCGSIQDQRM
jgi:hypothetical protein